MLEDPLSLALIAIAGVLIVFMFLSSRRRRRDAETQRAKIVPGVEVMTSQGIFGTLLSVDEDKNEAIIETTPGTKLRVHSQTIAKVVEETEPVADETADETADEPAAKKAAPKKPAASQRAQLNESSVQPMAEPEYGERTDKPKPAPRARKKPTE